MQYAHQAVLSGQNAWNNYANALYQPKVRPREMTAADLGLQEIWIGPKRVIGKWLSAGDAPYCFWLGADHG
jgi:hypothetical protein